MFEFVGLSPADARLTAAMSKRGKPASISKSAPAMLPEALQLVAGFYKPYNEQLAAILDDQAYLAWNSKYA